MFSSQMISHKHMTFAPGFAGTDVQVQLFLFFRRQLASDGMKGIPILLDLFQAFPAPGIFLGTAKNFQ